MGAIERPCNLNEAITGAIVRAADRHLIPVPLNRMLFALVRAREGAVRGGTDAN